MHVGIRMWVGKIPGLDRQLRLGRWSFLLRILVVVLLLLMVYPRGGAVWVMVETVTRYRCDGPRGEGLPERVGTSTL